MRVTGNLYLVWDWNGTLFDDVPVCIAVMDEMLQKRGLPPIGGPERYRELFTFPVSRYYEAAGLDFSHEPFAALAEEYIAAYNERARGCGLFPGTREVLAELQGLDVHQLIASASKADTLREQVAPFGIGPFFDALLGIEDIYGAGKAGLARQYFQEHGISPEDVLFVGDTVHDWEVAAETGCRCVLLCGGHQDRKRLEATGAPVLDGIGQLPSFWKEVWQSRVKSPLTLRPLELSDTDAVFAMTSDPEVARYMRFDTHTSREQAEELVRTYCAPGNLACLAVETETGEPAGVAALKQSGEEGVFDLSIFFAYCCWGKGYSTLATRKLLALGEQEGIKRVLGYVVAENTGSRRVLEKCGFQVERVLRFDDLQDGLYVYALDFDGKMKESRA